MAADALIAPFPQIKCGLAIFHILAEVLAQDMEKAVLMDCEGIIPSDFSVDEVYCPAHG